MRFIGFKAHYFLDQAIGVLILIYCLAGGPQSALERWLFMLLAAFISCSAAGTKADFKQGGWIGISTHLKSDVFLGILVILVLILGGFWTNHFVPHLICGLYLFQAGLFTTPPGRSD